MAWIAPDPFDWPPAVAALVQLVTYGVNRGSYRPDRVVESRQDALDRLLIALTFVGFAALPIANVLLPWLRTFDWSLPAGWRLSLGVAGCLLLAAAAYVFWRARLGLGHNWSPTLQILERQRLVTRGIYARIRHPMYLSIWLLAFAQLLLTQNWVVGPFALAAFAAMYALRVGREEAMLRDRFGSAYEGYMRRTGRLLPRLGRAQD